jgi:hypothetical protein
MFGLEGKTNVLPKGLRTALPKFSVDGNMVTKAPLVKPAPTTSAPDPSSSATPGGDTTLAPGTPAGTSGATTNAGKGATALPELHPSSGEPSTAPAKVVALGASGRSPPRTPAV